MSAEELSSSEEEDNVSNGSIPFHLRQRRTSDAAARATRPIRSHSLSETGTLPEWIEALKASQETGLLSGLARLLASDDTNQDPRPDPDVTTLTAKSFMDWPLIHPDLSWAFPALTSLTLTDGVLASLAGVERLTCLSYLDLTSNHIRLLDHLPSSGRLRTLILNDNPIQVLSPGQLDDQTALHTLAIGGTLLIDVMPTAHCLRVLPSLSALTLDGTCDGFPPSAGTLPTTPGYRAAMLMQLPWLKVLDGFPVTQDELDASAEVATDHWTRFPYGHVPPAPLMTVLMARELGVEMRVPPKVSRTVSAERIGAARYGGSEGWAPWHVARSVGAMTRSTSNTLEAGVCGAKFRPTDPAVIRSLTSPNGPRRSSADLFIDYYLDNPTVMAGRIATVRENQTPENPAYSKLTNWPWVVTVTRVVPQDSPAARAVPPSEEYEWPASTSDTRVDATGQTTDRKPAAGATIRTPLQGWSGPDWQRALKGDHSVAPGAKVRRMSHRFPDPVDPRQFEYHPSMPGWMVVGTTTGGLMVINHETGKLVGVVDPPDPLEDQRMPQHDIMGLCWLRGDPGKFMAATDRGSLTLHDVRHMVQGRSSVVYEFERFPQLTSVHVNAADSMFLTSGYDPVIALYDLHVGKKLRVLENLHTNHINVSKWSNLSPELFASSSFDRTVKVWDARGPCRSPVFAGKSSKGNVMCVWSPDDRYLLTSAVDNEIRQFDPRGTTDGGLVTKFDTRPLGSSTNFTRSYYMNGGEYVISGSCDESSVRVFSSVTGRLLREVDIGTLYGNDVAFYIQSLRGCPFYDFEASVLVAFRGHPSLLMDLVSVKMLSD